MKSMKKIAILLLVMLMVVPSMLFAGGGQEEAAPVAEEPADKTVRMFGAFRGEEAARFNEVLKPFIERTGINVIYEGSPEFETQILVQTEAGTPPDIAALPQPGLMMNLAERGYLKPLPASVTSKIDANYTSAWKDLGSYNGNVYGVFHRVNAKSFVWYPKKEWDAAGYEIPETWDEMIALSQQMIKDGRVPWSIGMESGGATGWVATDWMEDIMLRTAGPEVYDKWVSHEIAFDDPAVKNAAMIMTDLWMDDAFVLGGPTNILTTNFGDAVTPLFSSPAQAMMHRQGNFITGFMPEGVQANLEEEVGVFALPSINPEWGTPVLGGGDQFVMFSDRPEVVQVMEYLTTWESCKDWAAAGGALFPHQDQDFGDYASTLEADLAKILVNAEVFRFDASDLMPAEVGAGTFWTGMADLVSGVKLDKVLSQIDKSWP